MKKVILTISLIMVVLSLIYVFDTINTNLLNASKSNTKPKMYTGTEPPPPVPPDLGIRIYPELKEGSRLVSFKEKSITLHLTIVFKFTESINKILKIRVKGYNLAGQMFDFGWNGTHFVFGELEKQCKIRVARPVKYEVFFDKTEFFVGPNLNTELNVILKIFETPIDPYIKSVRDICPECNPNLVFVNESNFGPYIFTIVFDDYGYWNKYPGKGSGLMLVNYFTMHINLGGYIFLTNELYDQLYMQNKELVDQIYDYKRKYCSI
ncbi:MAG: hypothetical protein ACO2OV_06655 [Thermoproteota archaeon]|jgi:hypothetical protein